MSVFAAAIVIVGILFFKDEVRSIYTRKQINEAKESSEKCIIENSRERANALLALKNKQNAGELHE